MRSLQSTANVVLIVGRSGVGKSSLLEDLTDSTGHSQQTVNSATLKFEIENVTLDGEEYFVMDTPGFDAENEQETFREVIRGIQAIRPFGRIAGILYVTCINQPRFEQFDRRLAHFVYALCGQEFANLTFVTTFWTAQNARQQNVLNNQLELLRRHLQESASGQTIKMYQHGRQYDAGQDTGRFLNWYEYRHEVAQCAKDMISRRYGGLGQERGSLLTPKIIQELEDGVPVHYTDAGRLLELPIEPPEPVESDGTAPFAAAGGGLGAMPRPRFRVPDDGWEPPSRRNARPAATQSDPRVYEQSPSNLSDGSWQPVFDVLKAGCSWLMENSAMGSPATTSGVHNLSIGALYGSRDPNSVVDLMKSRGMESSLSSRAQYAAANGITGTAGSADWNTKILKHIQGGL